MQTAGMVRRSAGMELWMAGSIAAILSRCRRERPSPDDKVVGHLRSWIGLCGRGSPYRKTAQLSSDIGRGGESPWSASSKRRRRSHAPGAEVEVEAEVEDEKTVPGRRNSSKARA